MPQQDKINIRQKIYIIRGERVMLDFDLAELYGYSTRAFNQQVRRNKDRFDDDFYFKLSDDEYEHFRSQNVTSSWGGRRRVPYAFTEQGVYMLMTVLKGDLAVKQSKALVRMFKKMKDFVIDYNKCASKEKLDSVSRKMENILAEQKEIKAVVKGFIADKKVERLILDKEYIDGDFVYKGIYNSARKSIFIIDNYIGLKTLVLLKGIRNGVACTIFSNNAGAGLDKVELGDFRKQYPTIQLNFKKLGGGIHDRFIIVDYGTKDEKVYHCGGSSKDVGNKKMMVNEIRKSSEIDRMVQGLMKNERLRIK